MNEILNGRSASAPHLHRKLRRKERKHIDEGSPAMKRVTYALAGLLALTAGAASAQSSRYDSGNYTTQSPNGYYYDACKREQTSRGTVGAVLGGGAGAVIGSNVAARNARTEGALLGGLLGAIAGGVVGNKSAACTSNPNATASAYPTTASAPPPPPPAAESRYYDRDAYASNAQAREDAWATDRRGDRYRVTERAADPDGCTLAESPIYMPDGRTQTRFVRVCRDATGRYAVVD
jgi:hypothetical protein